MMARWAPNLALWPRWRFSFLAAAFLISATSSWWGEDIASTVVWHTVGVVAALVMWVGVALRRERRVGWALISAGLTAWVIGDITWDVLTWNEELPDVSVVDAWYLLGYLGFFAGLVTLLLAATGSLGREALIDGSVLALAVAMVVWVTIIEPSTEPGSALTQLVTVAYPTWAAILLATLAWMRFHPGRTRLDPGVTLLAAAVCLLVLLEPLSAWYYYYYYEPAIELESDIDRSFQLAFCLMALATFQRGDRAHRPDRHRLHPLRVAMLGASLAAGPTILVVAYDAQAVAAVGSVLISLLVLARFVLLTRERERSQAELAHLATHDAMTGLANRGLLLEALDHAVGESAARGDRAVGVLYIDVDRFEAINDTHGHDAGDRLLIEIAERIRASVRPGDIAARFGGDEFVVLCRHVAKPQDAVTVAQRLRNRLDEPIDIGSESLIARISVGVAVAPPRQVKAHTLLAWADAAMYEAKRAGTTGIAVHAEPMPDRSVAAVG